MRQEDQYEEDWMDEAPTLASLSRKPAPEPPEGYFEGLPSSVMARIQALEQPAEAPAPEVAPARHGGGKVLVMRRVWQWSAAASVALLIAAGAYLLTRPATTGETVTSVEAETFAELAALDAASVASGLEPESVSDEELYAMLGPEETATFDADAHGVEQDEAYEYLQEVDLDAIDLEGLDIDLEDLN